jgi:copper(I)-binding protein
MKTISKNVLLAAFALAISAAPSLAHDVKAGDLVISQAWSRATPGGAKVAGGYLVIENKGTAPDRLVGVSADIAGKSEIHEMAMDNGVMKMRALEKGLVVEPGKTVKLAPGGNHLMLQELKGPFKQGDKVPVTLQFEKAGKVAVSLDVQGVGAQAPGDAGHSGHMDMKKMPDHSGMKMK